MYAVNFPPVSDVQLNYNFDVSDLDFDTSAVEARSTSSQLDSQSFSAACTRPHRKDTAADSHSSKEDAAEALPSDWGIHILSMLSKDRTEPPAPDVHTTNAAANETPEIAPKQESLGEPATDQAVAEEREKKRRNQRAQKRHRDRQKVPAACTWLITHEQFLCSVVHHSHCVLCTGQRRRDSGHHC